MVQHHVAEAAGGELMQELLTPGTRVPPVGAAGDVSPDRDRGPSIGGDDGKIAMIRLEHAETGDEKQIDVGGAFVAIGHRPRSELVKGQVDLDGEGYVVVDEPSTKTKLAGVFAIGDLVDHTYRQAVTAAGSGTKGALDAEWYLRDMPPDPEEHWGTNTGAIVQAVEAS